MGSELVSDSLAQTGGSERLNRSAPLLTYTEQFYEVFPFYLSIGMTYEQFWEQDCCLTKYYREAEKLRRQKSNYDAWLQGMYIYEAFCDVSPVLQAFAKKGTKPHPYSTTPYALTNDDKKRKEKMVEKKGDNAAKNFLEAFAIRFNKRFEKENQNL